VVEQLSPVTFRVRHQLDGTEVKSHAEHLRLAKISDWPIPKARGKILRKATQVVAPESSSSDSEDEARQENARDRLNRGVRKEREHSSSEEDVPLMELRKRLRTRERRSLSAVEASFIKGTSDSSDDVGTDELCAIQPKLQTSGVREILEAILTLLPKKASN
jgi:hypothetical protein